MMTAKDLKKALLIINPVSGKRMVLRYIPQIIRSFMEGGYLVTTMVTGKKGDGTLFAKTFGGDFDLVCCTGGDGSLNETVCGLAQGKFTVPVGYIPCGSTNDFAASHGLSTDIPTAAENIVSGKSRRYDVGIFGSHYFTYVAAFGAFSWLSYTTDQNLKNVFGHTAYILDGIRDLPKVKPEHVKLTANGVTYEDDYIFGAVCNSLSIAGTIELPKNQVDTCDGQFEVLLIKNPKNLSEWDNVLRAVFQQDYDASSLVEFFHADSIDVVNPPGLEWALDGECSGFEENVHIGVLPNFLELRG